MFLNNIKVHFQEWNYFKHFNFNDKCCPIIISILFEIINSRKYKYTECRAWVLFKLWKRFILFLLLYSNNRVRVLCNYTCYDIILTVGRIRKQFITKHWSLKRTHCVKFTIFYLYVKRYCYYSWELIKISLRNELRKK